MDVAILGSGIAGLSTAIALAQKGIESTLYERTKVPSHIGAGMVLWPNAVFVLDQLGILAPVREVSGIPDHMRRLSPDNEPLGVIDIGLINRRMQYPSLSVLRQDLQSILFARLDDLGIQIKFDHSVDKIAHGKKNKLQVHFQNGLKFETDLIIGADGRMASISRKYTLGDNTPEYQGFINWIGAYESGEDVFNQASILDYWGIGKRFGIVPISSRKAYWAGGMASENIKPKEPGDYKYELSSEFENWPEPIQLMINNSMDKAINKIYVHDHHPVGSWHKNNLIMIGDAAHAALPTSGQGACQALEDAWHLSHCLVADMGDWQKAFNRFTQIRYEKTSNIIMTGRGLAASLFNIDEGYCKERDEKSKNTDFNAMAEAMANSWGQGLSFFQ